MEENGRESFQGGDISERRVVDKNVLGPSELFRHEDVELPLEEGLAFAENNQVLGPTDFSNQRLEFLMAALSASAQPQSPPPSAGCL